MRTNLLSTAVAVAVCGAMLVVGTATAVTRAPTVVTIKAQNGDFSGRISSPRPKRCANNRKVIVFKQLGSVQDPAHDTKMGSDISSLNGDHYEWSTGNSGAPNGKYYARAPQTPNCKADSSLTVRNVRTP
jgi:hypothetical protein